MILFKEKKKLQIDMIRSTIIIYIDLFLSSIGKTIKNEAIVTLSDSVFTKKMKRFIRVCWN